MSTVELEHVTVRHADTTLLDDITLTVADGELIGLVGASASGKTTLLRAIGGLEPVSAGSIRIGGEDVTSTPTSSRHVSMVFQTPALIPQRDVRGNVAFPLELRHDPDDEIATRVSAESRALHIEALLTRSPKDLSAGEAQLVQVARALVRMPSLLLLDEPLVHLDAVLMSRMRLELRELQRGYGVTTFLATNDELMAMTLPDRLVVLDHGRVVQVAPPLDVYDRPVNLAAATCTGPVSTLTASVESDGEGFWLAHPAFRLRAWSPSLAEHLAGAVVLAVRPSWMRIASDGPVHGTVEEANLVTGTVTVAIAGSGEPDVVEIAVHSPGLRRGSPVSFHLDQVAVFDAISGERLP